MFVGGLYLSMEFFYRILQNNLLFKKETVVMVRKYT